MRTICRKVFALMVLASLLAASIKPSYPLSIGTEIALAQTYNVLSPGSSGTDVTMLQMRLIALGYLSGTPTGEYDEGTREAVELFQEAIGKTASGIASAELQEILFSSDAPPYGSDAAPSTDAGENSDNSAPAHDYSDEPEIDLPDMQENVVQAKSIGEYLQEFQIDASSYYKNNPVPVFGYCAMDGDLMTAWNTNTRIAGEWIKISVQDGQKYQIAGLRLASGYWKDEKSYKNNSRPRTMDVYCDENFVQTITLKDERDYQTFYFAEPVVGSSVRLVLKDAYKGNKYVDCCITEMELLGPAANRLDAEAIGDWGQAVQKLAKYVMNGGKISSSNSGLQVVGLQLLLRDGFGLIDGQIDGVYGNKTREAVRALADQMRETLPKTKTMKDGVVDSGFWKNVIAYITYTNQ